MIEAILAALKTGELVKATPQTVSLRLKTKDGDEFAAPKVSLERLLKAAVSRENPHLPADFRADLEGSYSPTRGDLKSDPPSGGSGVPKK